MDFRTENTRVALSIREVAALTGLSPGTIHKLLTAGELTRRKVGKRTLILTEDLEIFLKQRPGVNFRLKPNGEGR